MAKKEIKYHKISKWYNPFARYKYELDERESFPTRITGYDIKHKFFSLTPDGLLTAERGYQWDGCSGPTIDTENTMAGGLLHDIFYQMIREGLLPPECRADADLELYWKLIDSKVMDFRAKYYYLGVKYLAWWAAKPKTRQQKEEEKES